MAAYSEVILSVTSDRTGNTDDMSSELNDFGDLGIAIGISTIHSLQVNIYNYSVLFRFSGRHFGFITFNSDSARMIWNKL